MNFVESVTSMQTTGKCTKLRLKTYTGRYHSRDAGIGGRIISKWTYLRYVRLNRI
jgi:hypothetical protein